MKWYWFVIYETDTKTVCLYSFQGWEEKWQAEKNLEARMSRDVPDVPMLPKKAYITDFGVELRK